MSEQLTTLDELHQEVDTVVVLENVVHVNDERVVDAIEDIFLQLDILELLVVNDDVLSDTLHSVDLLGVHVLN